MLNRDNHASRDTTTGKVNEDSIEQFLIDNFSDSVYPQAVVGTQFGTKKKHVVDILLGGKAYKKTKKARRWTSEHKGGKLISLKYQAVEGTAEEKILHECDKLQDAIDQHGYESAVIVLCGDHGWSFKDYYLSERYAKKVNLIAPNVTIISEETFRDEFAQ